MRPSFPHLLCAAAAIVALHACQPVPAATPAPAGQPSTDVAPDTSRAAQRQALQRARDAWARGGPRDYAYTVVRSCFCVGDYRGPARVTVRGGTASATLAESGQPATNFAVLSSVPALLDQIAAGLARNPASLVARYDASGVPLQYSIDPDPRIADDETGFIVSEFRALP